MIANLGGRQIYTQGGTMTRVGGDFDEDAEDSYCQSWPSTLHVEVTVTHGIDAEKLSRIRELNVPTLENDIGSLGGKVTLEGLRNLVVHQTIGKRWVHHPVLRSKQKLLEMEIDEHPATLRYRERLAELRRPVYLVRISVIVDAWNRLIVDGETTSPGRRWGSAQALRLTVAQSSTISLKRADLRPLLRLVLGLS